MNETMFLTHGLTPRALNLSRIANGSFRLSIDSTLAELSRGEIEKLKTMIDKALALDGGSRSDAARDRS